MTTGGQIEKSCGPVGANHKDLWLWAPAFAGATRAYSAAVSGTAAPAP